MDDNKQVPMDFWAPLVCFTAGEISWEEAMDEVGSYIRNRIKAAIDNAERTVALAYCPRCHMETRHICSDVCMQFVFRGGRRESTHFKSVQCSRCNNLVCDTEVTTK